MNFRTLTAALALAGAPAAAADFSAWTSSQSYNLHFQATFIDQGHSRIHAPSTGARSVQPYPESDVSVTSTLFFGWRLGRGVELYVDPELSGGQGISGARGMGGIPNAETYRVGNPQPIVKTARLYLQKSFALGGPTEAVDDGPNQLAGLAARDRFTVWAGKFGLMDWFDNNAYSHDPRSQFMNWTLANSGAWDYAADTYGYTWGVAAEYRAAAWAVRAGAAAEPKQANDVDLDRRLGQAHGLTFEAEHASPFESHKGTFRLLLFLNEADMGRYDSAVDLARQTGAVPDVTLSRSYSNTKYGFTSSDDLELAPDWGGFMRLSWNDGRNETWAFDEVDGSAALGTEWTPAAWGREQDRWGAAEAVNILSGPHRRYLAAGGVGFLLGDGSLHYGPELVTETYYRVQVRDWLQVSPDAQFIVNPGYNRARGPVPVWGVRFHVQF